jgi:hypothetical protein
MTLQVVDYVGSGSGAVVTLQSDNPNLSDAICELQTMAARNQAIAEGASRGLVRPAVGGMGQAPYPITAEGRVLQNPLTEKVAAYRVDIQISASPL